MAFDRVTNFSSFINHQIEQQERVESYLWKLEALLAVATATDGFFELSENTLHDYFSVTIALLEKASEANQLSLKQLLKDRNHE